jgi:hypothetical protein
VGRRAPRSGAVGVGGLEQLARRVETGELGRRGHDEHVGWRAGSRLLPNTNFAGLAHIVGQVPASYRDFQLERWAKSRNLGHPCETHLPQEVEG